MRRPRIGEKQFISMYKRKRKSRDIFITRIFDNMNVLSPHCNMRARIINGEMKRDTRKEVSAL